MRLELTDTSKTKKTPDFTSITKNMKETGVLLYTRKILQIKIIVCIN